MEPWKNKNLTLGERCVLFMKNEMDNNIQEDNLTSNTSVRIREYFAICTRLINGKEVPIGITKGSWCAAAGSYSLHQSLLEGEEPPHGYRVGVVEVVSDMQKKNLWRPVNLAISGQFKPEIGDVVVTDRSNPNDPSTSWLRHFLRVYSVSGSNFECISGNSGGKYRISKHSLTDKNLLGFGEYPGLVRNKLNVESNESLNPESIEDLTNNFYSEYNS